MVTNTDIQELLKTVGERIRTRRKARGLTQEKLAELADLSATYVAKLEAGAKTASLDTLLALGEALDIDAADLIRKREDSNNMNRARSISDALDGLSSEDTAFVIEEMLRLAAYLRQRSTY